MMEVDLKGTLTKFETMPRRLLYIGVYKLGPNYCAMSNENKHILIEQLQNIYGASEIKIYNVECG